MASVERPRKILIAHMEWSIEWPSELEDGLKGLCDTDAQVIKVAAKLDPASQRHVLLHEILHAIWYSCAVMPRLRRSDVEEDTVGALSGPLMDAIRQPGVAEFLTAR